MDEYKVKRTDSINELYKAQKDSNLKQLETAYEESRRQAQTALDKLPSQYQQQANELAAQYERNRRNFNQQASGSGLNTGTASQAALAQNSAWQRDYGNLRTSQAEAVSQAQQGLANLESQYKSDISAAISQNDYQRASALLDEYNRQYEQNLKQAQTLAAYGDFSAYSQIYGQEQADSMFEIWKAQNPDLAYRSGKISAEDYRSMTGKYPAGYTPPAATGGYSGGGSSYENAKGLSSSQIKALQKALGVTADGIWGDKTQSAYLSRLEANKIKNASPTAAGNYYKYYG